MTSLRQRPQLSLVCFRRRSGGIAAGGPLYFAQSLGLPPRLGEPAWARPGEEFPGPMELWDSSGYRKFTVNFSVADHQ
jgi:hypothetical protein